MTVASSELAGLIVLLGMLWGWYMLNRLWQIEVEERARDALSAVEPLGLSLRPAGLRARRVAAGRLPSGEDVVVEWRGGLGGLRSRVSVGDRETETSLLINKASLREAITAMQKAAERPVDEPPSGRLT